MNDDDLNEPVLSEDQDDYITTPATLSFKELYPTDYSYLEPRHRYTPEVAAAIFRKMVAGKTLEEVCNSPGFPNYRDVRVWMEHNPLFKKELEELQADRVRRSIDNMLVELETPPDELTPYEKNARQVQFERVKFFSERLLRDKYSPTMNHNVQGEVVTKIIIKSNIVRDIDQVKKLYEFSDEELKKIDKDVIDADYRKVPGVQSDEGRKSVVNEKEKISEAAKD